MFTRCFTDEEYEQAIGIALESRRLDIVELAIAKSGKESAKGLLDYVLETGMTLIQHIEFRNQVGFFFHFNRVFLIRPELTSKIIIRSSDYS